MTRMDEIEACLNGLEKTLLELTKPEWSSRKVVHRLQEEVEELRALAAARADRIVELEMELNVEQRYVEKELSSKSEQIENRVLWALAKLMGVKLPKDATVTALADMISDQANEAIGDVAIEVSKMQRRAERLEEQLEDTEAKLEETKNKLISEIAINALGAQDAAIKIRELEKKLKELEGAKAGEAALLIQENAWRGQVEELEQKVKELEGALKKEQELRIACEKRLASAYRAEVDGEKR